VAISEFEEKFKTNVHQCGLFINEMYPNFAASPDDLIDEETIIEVKCPYTARNEIVSESSQISFLEKNLNGELQLKRTHKYFFQIQGQLAISKRKKCILIVYTFKDLQTFNIHFDENFFHEQLHPSLTKFFEKVYLPFLVSKI